MENILQIAAASRIPGVTPAGIFRLMNYIKNHYNRTISAAEQPSS